MKRIVYEVAGGAVAVCIPSGEVPIEDVIAKDVPDGALMLVIDEADLPKDRIFRNAWEFNVGKTALTENLTKAKAIATAKVPGKAAAIAGAASIAALRAAVAADLA